MIWALNNILFFRGALISNKSAVETRSKIFLSYKDHRCWHNTVENPWPHISWLQVQWETGSFFSRLEIWDLLKCYYCRTISIKNFQTTGEDSISWVGRLCGGGRVAFRTCLQAGIKNDLTNNTAYIFVHLCDKAMVIRLYSTTITG